MTARQVTLGLVQMSTGDDRRENVDKAVARIAEAASRGAGIVCLQELFAGPYFCQVEDQELFDLAEPIPSPTTEAVASAAREHRVTVVASVYERRAPGLYHNTALVYGPDGALLGKYRKMHIPDDPLYYEKFYFAPGDLGFMSVRTPHAEVGPLVCWDQWYPEAARLTALAGAEILFYPTAIGWHPSERATHGDSQLAAWQTIQRSHAIANGVFVCAVNRVGHEGPKDGGLDFWGRSFVCDPTGTVIAEAGEEEAVLVVECDLGKIEEIRRGWPFFRDRRVDAYAGLGARFGK
ncbi:MAG: carbon-nitrogen hydrolase [Sorangiineae bacterium]|nr:carbon-nitrogen hydrolase [Polyangiaceae bacterium]MEB2322229.1 carbon-nitrogen hydrolase [Sorangiineae bacterium]